MAHPNLFTFPFPAPLPFLFLTFLVFWYGPSVDLSCHVELLDVETIGRLSAEKATGVVKNLSLTTGSLHALSRACPKGMLLV